MQGSPIKLMETLSKEAKLYLIDKVCDWPIPPKKNEVYQLVDLSSALQASFQLMLATWTWYVDFPPIITYSNSYFRV